MGRSRRRNKKKNVYSTKRQASEGDSNLLTSTSNESNACLESNDTFVFNGAERVHYLENLVSKQLDLYTWCEEKVTTLATIDTILLSGATLFVGRIKNDTFNMPTTNDFLAIVRRFIESNFTIFMVSMMFVPIFASLGLTLWHVIPKMNSGTTAPSIKNHRSSAGIHKYKDNTEYMERLDTLSEKDLISDLARQIYGMNRNIWKNQISIKVAVWFDLIGLLGFLLIMFYLVFTGNGSIIFS